MEESTMKMLMEQGDNHEKRITDLENNWGKVDNRLLSIENTVLKEGTRQSERQEELLDKLMGHHFNFKENRLVFYAKVWGTGGGIGAFIYLLLDKIP